MHGTQDLKHNIRVKCNGIMVQFQVWMMSRTTAYGGPEWERRSKGNRDKSMS